MAPAVAATALGLQWARGGNGSGGSVISDCGSGGGGDGGGSGGWQQWQQRQQDSYEFAWIRVAAVHQRSLAGEQMHQQQ